MNKSILLKKIKNKLLSKKTKINKYYKKTYTTYKFLLEIADPKYVKPINGNLRNYQIDLCKFAETWLKKFNELNIPYFLIAGNLLGAYRNNRFVPWDDDIDLAMMRKDFNILIDYLKTNYLEVDTKDMRYSLNNRSSVLKEHIDKYPNQISFAIFPTHLQILYGNNMESLVTLDIHPCDYFKDDYNFNEHQKYIANIKEKRTKIDNFQEILKFLENERKNNPNFVEESNNIYYGLDNYDAYVIQAKNWYKKEEIFPLQKILFENIEFLAPNDIVRFLTDTYGKNYNNMPNNIPLASHISYRKTAPRKNKKCKNTNLAKNILIKKLHRKFFRNKYEYVKNLYIDVKKRLDILIQVIDVKSLKPTKNKFIRQNQLAIVEFAKEITKFLESNNLEYFITSGTLIGAVRHQGFIPWDDDFDIGLMRKDYEKLKQILKEKFILVDTSKISAKKNNTTIILDETIRKNPNILICYLAPKYIQLYRGTSISNSVSVDIFPHEYYNEEYTFDEYKQKVSILTRNIKKCKNYKQEADYLHYESINDKNVVEKSSKIYYSFDSFGSYVVNHKKFMSQDMIFPRKKVLFEGVEFFAPNNPDGYITVQYENYMSLPSNLEVTPVLIKRSKQ